MISFEKMTNEEVIKFVNCCSYQEEEMLAENLEEATIDGINYDKAEHDFYHANRILRDHSETLEKFCTKEIIDQICAERDKMVNIVDAFEFGGPYVSLCNKYYHISDVKPNIEKVMKNRNMESAFKDAIEQANKYNYRCIEEFSEYMNGLGYTVTIEPTYGSEVDQ